MEYIINDTKIQDSCWERIWLLQGMNMRPGNDFKVRVDELISRDHWLYEQAMGGERKGNM